MQELIEKIRLLQRKQKFLKEMYEDEINILKMQLQTEMEQRAVEGSVKSATGIAFFKPFTNAKITDKVKFMKFVTDHKALDLLQMRISVSAYKRRTEEEGEEIPGVSYVTGETLVVKGLDEKEEAEE